MILICKNLIFVLAIILFSSFNVNANDDVATALKSSHVFGYAKAMYVADDKKGGRLNQSTAGFGGKIGIETGEYDGLKMKGAWYSTQDFGMNSNNPKKVDAYMFGLNKKPYSILGEAQFQFNYGGNKVIFGRQEFSSPMIESYEYRIIPNLFEAYTLINNSIDSTTMILSYVNKISGLDGLESFSNFLNMSQ